MHRFKRLLATNHEEGVRFLSSSTEAIIHPHFHQETHSNSPMAESKSQFLDLRFYSSSILSCKNISHIRQVHARFATSGMLTNPAVSNKLLYLYAFHRALLDARALFDEMTQRDSYTWTVMMGGYSKVGDYTNCLRMFRELIRHEITPDNYSLPIVIRACRDTMDSKLGRMIHCLISKYGLVSDCFVCAALVDMYAKLTVIEDAYQLFDKMAKRDLVTWTVMIGALAKSRNAMESLNLFDKMREEGLVPDKIAMVTLVDACAKLGAMHKAKLVNDYIDKMKLPLGVILGTALVDMYAKCGSIKLAREIFDKMEEKNVISWSAMIAAYGYHGQGRKALELFPMMLSSGILPNKITFVSLLYACSHSGLIKEGLEFFTLMQDKYNVGPDVKHYTCMVDLLGRAGRLDEAMKLIEGMEVKKDEGLFGALLGACRIHRNIDMSEKAAKALLELQPQNPGHYVLLSNIYANAKMWDKMAKIRDLMTERKLKKIPGWTWIEVDDKIYQFGVGDKSHPKTHEIYEKLNSLSEKLEKVGYVPDTNYVLHDIDEELKQGLLYTHSEKLALAFGLIASPNDGDPIRITKNLRVCGDCHTFIKFVSATMDRVIIVRDSNRFHHFENGACSCADYW